MSILAKQSIGSVIAIALGFFVGTITKLFVFPYICSKELLGQYAIFFYWAMVFSQFIAVGAGTIAIKYLLDYRSKKEEAKITYYTVVFPFFGIAAFTILYIPIAVFLVHAITTKLYVSVFMAVITIWVFTVTQTFIKSFSGLAIALNRSQGNFFISEFLTRLIVLIAFLCYYTSMVEFTGLLVLLMLSYITQLLLIVLSLRDFIFKHGISRPDKSDLKEKTVFGFYSLLDSGANAVVTRLDMLMISVLCINADKNAQEYDMSIAIATIIFLPWRSLSTTANPFVSDAFVKKDMNRMNDLYKKVSTSLFITGGLLFILVNVSLGDLIKIIPGDYSTIKLPVLFLGIAKMIDMVASINNSILLLSPYYKYNLLFNLILIVLTIFTNYLLIPYIGIIGSAIATAITILCFNVMKCIFLYSKYKVSPFSLSTLNCFVGLSVIYFLGFYFPSYTGRPLIDICIRSGFVFILFLVYFFTFKPSEDLMRAWHRTRDKFLS